MSYALINLNIQKQFLAFSMLDGLFRSQAGNQRSAAVEKTLWGRVPGRAAFRPGWVWIPLQPIKPETQICCCAWHVLIFLLVQFNVV